jgi:hypothetical protein
LGGTTGEFFDVLEISETQKQLRRGNVFYDVRTAIKYLKESQKYAGPRIFNDTTMPLLHALNQNVCVSHYLRIKCLTKKKKSAKNKSVTCGGRVPEVVVTSLGPLRHAKEKNSRQLRCVFITTVLFCDYLCLHSKRTINNALNPSIKKIR